MLTLSDNRVRRMVRVAELCYKVGVGLGLDSDICKNLYVHGLVHDIGYAFTDDVKRHNIEGYYALRGLSLELANTAMNHSSRAELNKLDFYSVIVTACDLCVDYNGTYVTTDERLDDIIERHNDKDSELCEMLKSQHEVLVDYIKDNSERLVGLPNLFQLIYFINNTMYGTIL